MPTGPNPACAECDLQAKRPPSNSLKLNNVRGSFTLEVSLLAVAKVATECQCRALADVFSRHTLCSFPCN